jgi:hypothetical protein
MFLDLLRLGKYSGVIERDQVAIFPREPWFVVERVDVTRPTLHKQKDDAFRAWREVRLLWQQRIRDGGGGFLVGDSTRGKIRKTTGRGLQCLASREQSVGDHDLHLIALLFLVH